MAVLVVGASMSVASPALALQNPAPNSNGAAKSKNKIEKTASRLKKQKLAEHIDQLLMERDAARAFWGIYAVDMDSGKALYALNENRLFRPASNTKLYTTAAALALVGADHRFKTTVETSGTVDSRGRLLGDLVLVGRGDPNLSGRTLPYNLRTERKLPPAQVLETLADQVVAKGVRMVDGDVIADDTYYAFERYGDGWAHDDLVWEWGAPVSALTINDNVVFVSIMPGDRAGERAYVSIDPYPDYYRVENRVLTTPAGSGPRQIHIARQPGSNQLTLWGSIPMGDSGSSEALAIEDPAQFASQLFRRMLEKRGVVVLGSTRARHLDLPNVAPFVVEQAPTAVGDESSRSAPQPAPQNLVLAEFESQPFAEDLRVINKVSQNLHAELALRLIGRTKGTAATVDSALEVLRGFLTEIGLQRDEYALFDGSGLSRRNLVTPAATVKLLRYAASQPWAASFVATLPVAGIDGSLSSRFKTGTATGRVRAKTGTLGDVNALAGYIETVKGRRVAFTVVVNNHRLRNRRGVEIIDKVVEALVDDDSYR